MLCIIGNLGDCAGTRVAVAEEDRLGGPAARASVRMRGPVRAVVASKD